MAEIYISFISINIFSVFSISLRMKRFLKLKHFVRNCTLWMIMIFKKIRTLKFENDEKIIINYDLVVWNWKCHNYLSMLSAVRLRTEQIPETVWKENM